MSYRINKEYFENLRHLTRMRLSDKIHLHAGNCVVDMKESFECCGKVYMYNFDNFTNPDPVRLFKQAIEIAKICEYSAIGLLHIKDNFFLKAAEETGFSPMISFHNKRSGNDLVEMILIL